LIFDEAITGFRLARGAQKFTESNPIFRRWKVIGGGLPVGAFGSGPK
jgi:glutamate-1-semialdehyde aminotransferase